jgi:hypothetical protein
MLSGEPVCELDIKRQPEEAGATIADEVLSALKRAAIESAKGRP